MSDGGSCSGWRRVMDRSLGNWAMGCSNRLRTCSSPAWNQPDFGLGWKQKVTLLGERLHTFGRCIYAITGVPAWTGIVTKMNL